MPGGRGAAITGHLIAQDYDGWDGMGNPGWSFGDVLPFFRRLEADADFGDEWHGTEGPVPPAGRSTRWSPSIRR